MLSVKVCRLMDDIIFTADSTNAAAAVAQAAIQQANAVKHLVNKQVSVYQAESVPTGTFTQNFVLVIGQLNICTVLYDFSLISHTSYQKYLLTLLTITDLNSRVII